MNNNSEDLNGSNLLNHLSHESQNRANNVDALVQNTSDDLNVTTTIDLQSSQEELSVSSAVPLPSNELNAMSGSGSFQSVLSGGGTASASTSTAILGPTSEPIALTSIKTNLLHSSEALALAGSLIDRQNSAPKKVAISHNHRSHIRDDDDYEPPLTSHLACPSIAFETRGFALSAPVNTSLGSFVDSGSAAATVSPVNADHAGRDWRQEANVAPPPPLTSTPTEGIIPTFIANLRDRSPDVRRDAATALMSMALRSSNQLAIARAGAIDLLVALLDDPDTATRRSATGTLKLLAQHPENRPFVARPEVVNPLASLLSDPDVAGVQRNAGDALVNIARLVEPNEIREAGADTVGGAARDDGRHEGIIPTFIANLRDRSPDVRRDAATALMSMALRSSNQLAIARAGAIDLLVALLDDPDTATRRSATGTLKLLAQHPENRPFVARPEVVNPLASLLSDPDVAGVQRNAGDALVNIARLVEPNEIREAGADTVGGAARDDGRHDASTPTPTMRPEDHHRPSNGCTIA